MKSISIHIFIMEISSLELKGCFKKGYQLYATHVEEPRKCISPNLQNFPALQDMQRYLGRYKVYHQIEILFSTKWILGAAPVYKTPYKTSTLKEVYVPKCLLSGTYNDFCEEKMGLYDYALILVNQTREL
jgi:hypothetical protein